MPPWVGFHTIRSHNDTGALMADDEKIELSGQDARAGATPHVTRYVLAISLTLVVVAFAALLFLYR